MSFSVVPVRKRTRVQSKLARKWGQKNKAGAFEIITFVNGFHGRNFGDHVGQRQGRLGHDVCPAGRWLS